MQLPCVLPLAMLLALLSACAPSPDPLLTGLEQRTTALESSVNRLGDAMYRPSVRDIMASIDRTYCELGFAVEARNWALASFELAGLAEQTAVLTRYRPVASMVPQPMSDAVSVTMKPALERMRPTIDQRDLIAARAAYGALTAACNVCHSTSGMGFLRVTRPAVRGSSSLALSP